MPRKIAIKEYNQGQTILFPESLDSRIPPDSPVRLINDIVEQLDLTAVSESYAGGGSSCYSPRMMLKVLFYGYMNNIYSCRKIARAMEENIHYMWLSGNQFPKYNTINNFRSDHLKDAINGLFTQVVVMLVETGYLTLKEQYIDGTKMESRANKYTFVWRKSLEKNKSNLEAKIRRVLAEIESGIITDNTSEDELPVPIDPDRLRERIAEINRENKSKKQQKLLKEIEDKYIPKLEEYDEKLTICGERNSYSKTDPDATFMRLKEDEMNNGQTKPAYNLQVSTENQFITDFAFYSNPGDTLTMIPFLESHESRYGKMPDTVVADAGYGSEENYAFMENNGIDAYVKYNYFHQEQKRSYKNNAFLPDNLYYNTEDDYFICPMGQHMNFVENTERASESGYISHLHVYQAQNCQGCPLRGPCHKAKGNRRIEINHTLRSYRKKARELLTSEQGLRHRKRRPIEPEAVFGQMKADKNYKRLRYFGKEKITLDFAVFAIAFNIGKMWNKGRKTKKSAKNRIIVLCFILFDKNNAPARKITLSNIPEIQNAP
jgi:transposase